MVGIDAQIGLASVVRVAVAVVERLVADREIALVLQVAARGGVEDAARLAALAAAAEVGAIDRHALACRTA